MSEVPLYMSQRKSLVHILDRQTFIDDNMASKQLPTPPETKSSRMPPVQERGSPLQERVSCFRRKIKKSFAVVDKTNQTHKVIKHQLQNLSWKLETICVCIVN